MSYRCKAITRWGTRCLNASRIKSLCLIHYKQKKKISKKFVDYLIEDNK